MGRKSLRRRRRDDQVREAGLARMGLSGYGEESGTKALQDAGIAYDSVEQAVVGYCYGGRPAASARSTASA